MKRVNAVGQSTARRFDVSAGGDVDKNIVVIGLYITQENSIETREFAQDIPSANKAAKWLLDHQAEIVILESTANYHMLFYDVFRDHKLNVQVINPILVKALLRAEGKSDKGDAMTLAKLAASFPLKTSNMPDNEQRKIRVYLRNLDKRKVRRTQLTNRINSLLTGYSIPIFREIKVNTVSGRLILEGILNRSLTPIEIVDLGWKGRGNRKPVLVEKLLGIDKLDDYAHDILDELYFELDYVNSKIEEQDIKCHQMIVDLGLISQVTAMNTAPAMNDLLSLRIIGEMGQNYWERYHSADAFAKAIGVVPNNIVSGGKILKKKTSHGNIHVKRHLLNAVKGWLLHAPENQPLKQFYVNYKSRSSYRRAVAAVARKIARSLWFMGTKNQLYYPQIRHNQLAHEEVSNG